MDLVMTIATTLHLGLSGDYNEVHPSVQLRFDNGTVAGAYHNSMDTLSVYVGHRSEFQSLSIEGGVATGYNDSVVPYGRISYNWDNLSVFVAPAFEFDNDKNYGVVVGVEYSVEVMSNG